jgi:hypothetical protein
VRGTRQGGKEARRLLGSLQEGTADGADMHTCTQPYTFLNTVTYCLHNPYASRCSS